MSSAGLLVANRGEVAVRIMRAAQALQIRTVAVCSLDDEGTLHHRLADDVVLLDTVGPAAYLNADNLVAAARATGCNLLHPGWGFLSEQPGLARKCAASGITFVGPDPETLHVLGDKVQARALASDLGLPVLASTDGAASLSRVAQLLNASGPGRGVMLKAIAGGGGRGIRVVTSENDLPAAYRDCAAEAQAAFGDGRLFAEMYLPRCRHIEVQVIGDGCGNIAVLGDRDCSIQRNWQKLIEIAPAPELPTPTRTELWTAARRLAAAVTYRGAGTFEFLLDVNDGSWWFMEANPRLQVEHTITEQVSGVDIVQTQLNIALGSSLTDLGLAVDQAATAGTAIELRLNAERMAPNGAVLPSAGTLRRLRLPSGTGIRVDTGLAVGDAVSPRFDSLLAKIIVHTPEGQLADAVALAREALAQTEVEGVHTNANLLAALLDDRRLASAHITTAFLKTHLDSSALGLEKSPPPPSGGLLRQSSDMAGIIVRVEVEEGQMVEAGDDLVHVEAMKMQHVTVASVGGRVTRVVAEVGQECRPDDVLLEIDTTVTSPVAERAAAIGTTQDEEWATSMLEGLASARRLAHDDARAQSRTVNGELTLRQKVTTLFDADSLMEHGALVIPSRLWKQTEDELARRSPADGVLTGLGTVEGIRCGVVGYDPAVMAGTQGHNGSQKVARLLDLAARSAIPVILFADGGGGRPGDDAPGTNAPPLEIFRQFAALSGRVPLIGAVSSACFGGNAAMLACCDVVVATAGANVGMAGPAVIEAGGLGAFPIKEIGPAPLLHQRGLIDVLVDDDSAAVVTIGRVLSYFSSAEAEWEPNDQSQLRTTIPHNRLRAYDVLQVVRGLADKGSVSELKPAFGPAMVTAFARVEGLPVGVIANNPKHGAGAIDGEGAGKAATFAKLCDRNGIPLVFLCDTPGFAVGPEAEASGQLRSFAEFLIAGSQLTVPFMTVVIRKAYGLGAVAMCGGSFRAPAAVVSWPTGEFAGMAPEAAVRLSSGKDLAAIVDPAERESESARLVAAARDATRAIRAARRFRIDDVIDPTETRAWIRAALAQAPSRSKVQGYRT